ncbi:hypothetical protein VNI00_003138 [Paramarasmius palmivorus]|uniref:triacylglycerol lipase n=1 Tax=Paramarasmius palmivorus TaxID=297713 RepID=A0AAW0DUE9_9AGAR
MVALSVFAALLTPCLVSGAIYKQTSLQFPYHHDIGRLPDESSTSLSHLAATPTLKARPTTVYRPRSIDVVEQARQRSLLYEENEALEWNAVDVLGPDIEDRHTLVQLGRMAGNAYALPGRTNWYDLDEVWNTSFPFGWEDSEDGFRGHVFLSSDNSTVILSIKGTTLQGPTSWKDKLNDNLLVGHSLGGALASLLGSTFGLPAVAFESPGERLAAERLHLPLPPRLANSSSILPVTHVYHTADPIPQGVCTGFASACAQAGYALETRCHLGKSIVYDTVGILGWYVDVRTHIIKDVIHRVLEAEDVEWEEGRDVPEARLRRKIVS